MVRLQHFPPLCPSGAIGRRAVLRRLFLWVRIPSWTPWPAGQIGKGASLRRKRFSRFEAGAGHQVIATKLCRRTRIGLSAELKPPCLSVRIRPPAPCARSPIGRGGRLKPGSRAGSKPAARTTGDMTRLEERRTPNPFLQGSNPWSPANKFAPEAHWRSGCLQSSSW